MTVTKWTYNAHEVGWLERCSETENKNTKGGEALWVPSQAASLITFKDDFAEEVY